MDVESLKVEISVKDFFAIMMELKQRKYLLEEAGKRIKFLEEKIIELKEKGGKNE